MADDPNKEMQNQDERPSLDEPDEPQLPARIVDLSEKATSIQTSSPNSYGAETSSYSTASSESEGFNPEKLMTVVEHLDELRNRIIRCILYVAVGLASALLITKDILRLMEKPAGNIQFQALSLEEPLVVFIKVAFYTGLVLASPLILYEASQFVSPGLTKKERQVMAPIVVGGPCLFVLGAAFAYFCLLPPMLHFFGSFGAGVTPINQRLDYYVSLVSSLLLYMGLCFQLPIVIFALSFTGLINSTMLMKIWRYAVFGAATVAAVVTPDPTAFSMLLVMAALCGLYFISVLMLKLFGR